MRGGLNKAAFPNVGFTPHRGTFSLFKEDSFETGIIHTLNGTFPVT